MSIKNFRWSYFANTQSTIRWVWQVAWSTNQALLIGFLLMTFLESVVPAAMVITGRGLINGLVNGLRQGQGNVNDLLPWLVLGATLAIGNAIISNLGDYWQQGLQAEINLRVGLDVLHQAGRLELAFLESSEAQDRLERARRYGNGMVAQVLFKLVTVANQSIRLCSLVGILLWIEPLVVGWLCVLALPYLFFKWRLANRSFAVQQRRTLKNRWNSYFIYMLTQPQGLPEIKFLHLTSLFIERFRQFNREFIAEDRKLAWLSLLGNTLLAIVGGATLYLLFGRIATRVFAGMLTVGDVAIYTGSAMQLQNTMQSLIQTITTLHEQVLYTRDLQAFLTLQPNQCATNAAQPSKGILLAKTAIDGQQSAAIATNGIHPATVPSPTWAAETRLSQEWDSGAIEFVDVSFTYPDNEQPALSNLSFCIAPGETVAVVGENGAGKSTLAMLLARLYEPTSGYIRVGGIDLRTIDPVAWQQQMGFVFQKFTQYEATVRENIAYGNWDYLNERPTAVEDLARLAQVEQLIEHLPQGYETRLGRQFAKRTLSLGQWQRLALARGLARPDARLLILDEPSASLDARAEYELFSGFRQAAHRRTTLLISHRFSTIRLADRILVLDRGRLIEYGTHTALLAQAGQYATLYRLHRDQTGEPVE